MPSASKVIVLVSGGREELLVEAKRFAWELEPLPGMEADGILGTSQRRDHPAGTTPGPRLAGAHASSETAYAWDKYALNQYDSDSMRVGVAVVPFEVVAELQRRCAVDKRTGALVEHGGAADAERLLSLRPRKSGTHWHKCRPDASDPNGCPLGLGRDYAATGTCAFAGRNRRWRLL
jgi:hypothetical protein